MTKANTVEDFHNKYEATPSGCWEWQPCTDSRGYGQFALNGKYILAHRLSWEITHGPILGGLFVLHTCDNRRCVNPEHLFLGNHDDNAKDRVIKGREGNRKGTENGRAWLDENKVREIRQSKKTCAELAVIYAVSWNTIKNVKEGRTWRHVI